MKKIKDYILQGQLQLAKEQLEKQLKDDPLSVEVRSVYVELLCVMGELEKADQQLDMMVRQHPECLLGAVNLRHLIRAQTARQDFYQGGVTATLFHKADDSYETLLELHLNLREGDIDTAQALAAKLESLRNSVQIEIDGTLVTELRDLDDSLGGYLELLGTDGKFYLVKFSEIESLELQPVSSTVEMVWRRVNIAIKNGPSGEAFLPLCYMSSTSELCIIGKETAWDERSDYLVTGVGQKMLLVNDQALPLGQIKHFQCAAVELNSDEK